MKGNERTKWRKMYLRRGRSSLGEDVGAKGGPRWARVGAAVRSSSSLRSWRVMRDFLR